MRFDRTSSGDSARIKQSAPQTPDPSASRIEVASDSFANAKDDLTTPPLFGEKVGPAPSFDDTAEIDDGPPLFQRPSSTSHVIVVGSEKGGTGKSTVAMHLSVALMKLGYTVGTLDLDGRQGTLSTYMDNRCRFGERLGATIEMPTHRRLEAGRTVDDDRESQTALFREAFLGLCDRDFVVIDTPGDGSYLTRLAHLNADTVVTPLNDSLLDVAVLAHLDRDRHEAYAPGCYTTMLWEQSNHRVTHGCSPIRWVVMRNRLSPLDARNKREINDLLMLLARRLGFRLTAGFGERVVFRELFPLGLTVLDLPDTHPDRALTLSHRSGGQEIRQLLVAVGLVNAAAA